MRKCDFCTQSDQNGKCPWLSASTRQKYCATAIKTMEKALKQLSKSGRRRPVQWTP